jgi:uncharacterized protein
MLEKRALNLLKMKFPHRPEVIKHCILVSKKAVEIARKLKKRGIEVDVKLVKLGGLLHDIGRCVTNDVTHGYEGGKILRNLGYPKLARIAETHVGGGITAEESEKLGLPKKDFMPRTLEEKIVCYADKFIETKLVFGSDAEEWVKFEEIEYPNINKTLRKFERKLGKDHVSIKGLCKIRDEIERLLR